MVKRVVRIVSIGVVLSLVLTTAFTQIAFAQDGDVSAAEITYAINNFALFICAVLVLFMQAGFALVRESVSISPSMAQQLIR